MARAAKGSVLVTGANGYIGRRLIPQLVNQGYKVICMVRSKTRFALNPHLARCVEVLEADLLQPDSLTQIPKNISAAYYLVHSMASNKADFTQLEEKCAQNFTTAIKTTKAQQIIYLGGISNDKNLSEHLHSRQKIEATLSQSNAKLTVLRSAIIVGSGSASFEIIRDLVEKLPIMITPKWLKTRCQPIAIRNVIDYLTGVLLHKKTYGRCFDIGGPDILTYKQMLLRFAKNRGYRRLIITLPILTPHLSSYWLYFVTATSFQLAKHLVGSMKNEVICSETDIKEIVPIDLLSYDKAVQAAFYKIEQNLVVSSWKDALNNENQKKFSEFIHAPTFGCFKDEQVMKFTRPQNEVIANVFSIGGERGWYYANFLWQIRGFIDLLVGGVGLRRGRRSATDLRAGDALDFWRVIYANKAEGRLLRYAEMKLPGEAWLEFKTEGKNAIKQTATFRPRGILGRAYWYALVPLHFLIFGNMLKAITEFREEPEQKIEISNKAITKNS